MLSGVKMSPTTDAPPTTGTKIECKEYECSVPISLSALFGGSSKKCIPIGKLNEPINIKLYLTNNVNDVYMSKTGTTGAANYDMDKSDYQITDVSLECHQVRFTDSVDVNLSHGIATSYLVALIILTRHFSKTRFCYLILSLTMLKVL